MTKNRVKDDIRRASRVSRNAATASATSPDPSIPIRTAAISKSPASASKVLETSVWRERLDLEHPLS